MSSNGLYLNGSSLCSKWGFGDGDAPEAFYDFCDDAGFDYNNLEWHPVLVRLVRERLLPLIKAEHEIDVYEIETIHNPIRASSVDGEPLDDYSLWDDERLAGFSVTVPWSEVASTAGF